MTGEDGEEVEGGRGGGVEVVGSCVQEPSSGNKCSFFFPLCTKAAFPAHLTTRVLNWNTVARGDFAGHFSEL